MTKVEPINKITKDFRNQISLPNHDLAASEGSRDELNVSFSNILEHCVEVIFNGE